MVWISIAWNAKGFEGTQGYESRTYKCPDYLSHIYRFTDLGNSKQRTSRSEEAALTEFTHPLVKSSSILSCI